MLLPRDTSSNGTVAVIVFIAGAIILVLTIILVLLYFKKRRSARAREARMVSGKEFLPHRKVGRYGKLEEDDEQAWSAEMEAGHGEGERERERGGYAPVSTNVLFTEKMGAGLIGTGS